MISKRSPRRFTPEFKFQVALEAVKGKQTLAELSSRFAIHALLFGTSLGINLE